MKEVKNQVEHILRSYTAMKREVQVLAFELERFNANLNSEAIRNRTFSHSTYERISGSHISDKTANIAIDHYDSQINGEYHALRTLIGNMQVEINRIDHYLTLIPNDEARVLKLFYFEGITVAEISKKIHRSPRTVYRMKEHAIGEIIRYYSLLDSANLKDVDIFTRMRFVSYVHEGRFKGCLERLTKNITPGMEAMLYILCGCNELWQAGIETFFDFELSATISHTDSHTSLSGESKRLLSLAFHFANDFDRNNLVHDLRYYFSDLEYVHLELAIEAMKVALMPGR